MSASISKSIGSPTTISGVQRARTLSSVAVVIDAQGAYAVVISYQETLTDSGGNPVGIALIATKTISDASLNAAAKTEIDSIYTRALAAI